ncbi:MAG: CRISPR-associated exonuclease Cas4/endonuclease Cas1 fusion [Thermoanaerobaculia bacterium]|nr:CRISPR-associated exonuclease Cas4/endonuclease Cas1 fusion [Thermoanaerobaculia bacterium]
MNVESPLAPLPARMLNEYVYCPRLFFLEHVAGEWEESADTVAGRRVHRRVDRPAQAIPDPERLNTEWKVRSVDVASEIHGVTATCDLIEGEGEEAHPVDYKKGKAPDPDRVPGGVWPADRVQIGAQILALRECGYSCEAGSIYYAETKKRVRVPWSQDLESLVLGAISGAREAERSAVPPQPLVDSPKCPKCSLVGICLPDESTLLGQPAQASEPREIRKLLPPNDDRRPLYVKAHGATVGLAGGELEVRQRDAETVTVRLQDTSHVSLLGNIQITAGALKALCDQGIGVSYFSYGGWHFASLNGYPSASVHHRIAQFRVFFDPEGRVRLARQFIRAKILNCRTLLRRNSGEGEDAALALLKKGADDAATAESLESLLGIEGLAARTYFDGFARVLQGKDGVSRFELSGRNRRPPRDPVNALLSFAYALLVKDCRIAVAAAGLDPMVGLLHQPRPGRPAMALDMMEEFRPLIADSAVLTAINTGVVTGEDFVRGAGRVALTDGGRKAFLGAYERRMEQEIQHPVFGYRVSYRQVLEIQARLLARTLTGEIGVYPAFLTR